MPYGFVGHRDPPLSQQVFDVAVTQSKAVIKPKGVGDDISWKAIAREQISGWFHPTLLYFHLWLVNLTIPRNAAKEIISMSWYAN